MVVVEEWGGGSQKSWRSWRRGRILEAGIIARSFKDGLKALACDAFATTVRDARLSLVSAIS